MSSGNTFSKLFGQSPFTALQEHMRVVVECAHEVQPLIEALAQCARNAGREVATPEEARAILGLRAAA